jgi:hypothetical protein
MRLASAFSVSADFVTGTTSKSSTRSAQNAIHSCSRATSSVSMICQTRPRPASTHESTYDSPSGMPRPCSWNWR